MLKSLLIAVALLSPATLIAAGGQEPQPTPTPTATATPTYDGSGSGGASVAPHHAQPTTVSSVANHPHSPSPNRQCQVINRRVVCR